MNKILLFALTLALFASCKQAQPTVSKYTAAPAVVAPVFSWHPNYCLLANGDISAISGPIYCQPEHHIDEDCVAHARANYVATVKAVYQIACDLARQYKKDHDTAVAGCGNNQTCIDEADALLETSLSTLDGVVTTAINTAIALYWEEVSYCCVADHQ